MTTTPVAAGVLVHINPDDLYLGDNVRTEATIGTAFETSIATHGVLQPISAIRHDDGSVEVRDGQRRTLAARAAGLTSVPVYVVTDAAADAKTATLERITHQLVANEQREALTQGQRITAVEQMLNLGVTPTKAAKALGIKRSTVDAIAATVKSERARHEAETGALTLEQAAAIAEFDGDEDTVEDLMRAARWQSSFDHVLAQKRERREERARMAQATKAYIERGFTIEPHELFTFSGSTQPMRWLRTADGEPVTEEHITDPKIWSVYVREDNVYLDTVTGEIVSERKIDWRCKTEGDPVARVNNREDDEYLVPVWRTSHSYDYTPTFYCHDPAAEGFTGRDRSPLAPAATEQEEAEKARAQRRRVIALNKLFKTATGVRETFLRNLLARKTPPPTTAVWTATHLTRDVGLISEYNARSIASDLLGNKAHVLYADMVPDGTSENRAQVITLALVLGAYEARAQKHTWRQWDGSRVDEYLRFLRDLGYQLSEIEEVMTKERTPEDVTLPD